MRRLRLYLLLTFCLALGFTARAQSSLAPSVAAAPPVKTITLGRAIVALYGPWKFHIGDNPKWADADFDDSQWETVDLTPKSGSFDPIGGIPGYVPGWTAKGHPGAWGYGWYRIRVRVIASAGEKLAINAPSDVDDAYQVFANGRLLGSFGKFSTGQKFPVFYFTQPRMFLLPQLNHASATATYVLAFRLWMAPLDVAVVPDAGGMHDAPLLGQLGVVTARYHLDWLQMIRDHVSTLILAALFFLLAVLAGCMFLLDRSDTVYLWMAGVLVLLAIDSSLTCLSTWTEVLSLPAANRIVGTIVSSVSYGCWAMMWWVWFRLRRPSWVPRLIVLLTIAVALCSELSGDPIFLTSFSLSVAHALRRAGNTVFVALIILTIWIAVQGIRKRGWEGWLAMPAVLLYGVAAYQLALAVLHVRTIWFPFGVSLSLRTIAYLLLAAVIFVLLMRRLMLSIRRQKEQALDVKQAAEVQHVLIPEQLPQIPGLAIESEYRPATEVGGDFFQIIPNPTDGSVLIVVGDVTGHGLQAGMLVALIVGVIRTVMQYESDPLAILKVLNQRLYGRGEAHATCLALRIASDGDCALANAGHLAPYLNGKELPMEGSLPLGMIEAVDFSQMNFHLNESDSLILMSDGVVEAQDEHGHLFGFDRTQAMLQPPITAAKIATEAQNFGQQDDILVLRVERRPQPTKTWIAEPVAVTL